MNLLNPAEYRHLFRNKQSKVILSVPANEIFTDWENWMESNEAKDEEKE